LIKERGNREVFFNTTKHPGRTFFDETDYSTGYIFCIIYPIDVVLYKLQDTEVSSGPEGVVQTLIVLIRRGEEIK